MIMAYGAYNKNSGWIWSMYKVGINAMGMPNYLRWMKMSLNEYKFG